MTDVDRVLADLTGATERVETDHYVFAPTSAKAATLTIRLGTTVAYAERIGYAAQRYEILRAESPCAALWVRVGAETDAEHVLWPLDAPIPSPQDVVNWARYLEVEALRDVVTGIHGLDARGASERACRALIGHAYQYEWRKRVGLSVVAGDWLAKVVAARRCLIERVHDGAYAARFDALVAMNLKNERGGVEMFGLDETESEMIANLNDRTDVPDPDRKTSAIVKKRVVRIVMPENVGNDSDTEESRSVARRKASQRGDMGPDFSRPAQPVEIVAPTAKRRGRPPGKAKVSAATSSAEETPADAPAKKTRRKKGKRKAKARRAKKKTQIDLPGGAAHPNGPSVSLDDASTHVGTYHGRGTPPEGIPILSVGAPRGDGRVRVVLADGTKITCDPSKIRQTGAETDTRNEAAVGGVKRVVYDERGSSKSAGRPSRQVLAQRELTRQVLEIMGRAVAGGDPAMTVVVVLTQADALTLIGHGPCEFCGKLVDATVGICDGCSELRMHVEANPEVARKILRRAKAASE